MNASKPVAVGLGEILWDLLPGGKQLGGAPANFAYHAAVQGAASAVVSAVGDDSLGREILSHLARLQLDAACVVTDRVHPTGTVGVTLDAAGVPEYTIHEPAAWDFVPWSERLAAMARQCDIVCFGSLGQRSPLTRETIQQFLRATRPDCLRVFDINLRQRYFTTEIVTQSLDLTVVFKLNDHELPHVAELLQIGGNERAVTKALFEAFPLQLIAITRGDAGSTLYTRLARHDHPGYPARVIDTVGAGDAFTATLALGLARVESVELIHDRANRAASFVCSQAGATPTIPREVLAREG